MTGLRVTLRRFLLLLITVFPAMLPAADLQLPDGTPVLLALKQNVSSESSRMGAKVEFTVVADVKLQDLLVIRKGAPAWGIVKDPKEIKNRDGAGGTGVHLENVEMANGAKAPLREDRSGIQESGTAAKVAGGAATTTKTIGRISTAGLLFKGKKHVTIPAGTEVKALVKGIVLIDPADFTRAAEPQPAPPAGAPAGPVPEQGRKLTNQDILRLKSLDFSDDVLIAKIKSSPAEFHTEPDDLIDLKKAGLSDAVIRAMIESRK